MNRRDLLQSLIAAPVAACLPALAEQNQFVTFASPLGAIRGHISYNPAGGMVRYSVAHDPRNKLGVKRLAEKIKNKEVLA